MHQRASSCQSFRAVVSRQALTNGWHAALLCIFGEQLGGVCLMVVSLLGVGAALAASPLAFQALMWFGVGFWTAFLHPKSLVFYLAFFTQFVDAAKPLALQYVPLIGAAATVAGIVLGGYVLISVRLKPHI